MSKVRPKQGKTVEVNVVAESFPFHKYFSNAPQPVFKGRTYEEDMDIAEGCYRHIKKIFTQLEVRARTHRPASLNVILKRYVLLTNSATRFLWHTNLSRDLLLKTIELHKKHQDR